VIIVISLVGGILCVCKQVKKCSFSCCSRSHTRKLSRAVRIEINYTYYVDLSITKTCFEVILKIRQPGEKRIFRFSRHCSFLLVSHKREDKTRLLQTHSKDE